jgi:D-lyxose ketol-isomerase
MTRPQPTFLLRLTNSQRMALLDIISMVMVPPVEMREFHDVTHDVITTPGELLGLLLNAPAERPRETNGKG